MTPSLAAANAKCNKQGHYRKRKVGLIAQWGHQGDGETRYNDPGLKGKNGGIKSSQKEKGKNPNFRSRRAFEGKNRQTWTLWHLGKVRLLRFPGLAYHHWPPSALGTVSSHPLSHTHLKLQLKSCRLLQGPLRRCPSSPFLFLSSCQ